MGTDPAYNGDPRPDYDWTAGISAAEGDITVMDPDGLLGNNSPSEVNEAASMAATVRVEELPLGVSDLSLEEAGFENSTTSDGETLYLLSYEGSGELSVDAEATTTRELEDGASVIFGLRQGGPDGQVLENPAASSTSTSFALSEEPARYYLNAAVDADGDGSISSEEREDGEAGQYIEVHFFDGIQFEDANNSSSGVHDTADEVYSHYLEGWHEGGGQLRTSIDLPPQVASQVMLSINGDSTGTLESAMADAVALEIGLSTISLSKGDGDAFETLEIGVADDDVFIEEDEEYGGIKPQDVAWFIQYQTNTGNDVLINEGPLLERYRSDEDVIEAARRTEQDIIVELTRKLYDGSASEGDTLYLQPAWHFPDVTDSIFSLGDRTQISEAVITIDQVELGDDGLPESFRASGVYHLSP